MTENLDAALHALLSQYFDAAAYVVNKLPGLADVPPRRQRKEFMRLARDLEPLAAAIRETPALTFSGLCGKAHAAAWCPGSLDPRMAESIVHDLRALSPFAGLPRP